VYQRFSGFARQTLQIAPLNIYSFTNALHSIYTN